MTTQDIQQMIEQRIAELNTTAEQKKQELKGLLAQDIEKSESFLTLLKNEQERLQNQLAQINDTMTMLEQPLVFHDILEEFEQSLTQDNVDLNELNQTIQHRLQESMNQQMNERKAQLLSTQQALVETLSTSQNTLSRTPKLWQQLNAQLQARFGDKIQKAKMKLAEQLESCAGKLKA
ncbi:hypothetical protein C5N92_06525 [Glaesserella australis]|uniref:Uncharacterized protein n=2 Tax=Pasteurellaceae TaxID=712 RepID=A0A328C0H5_9PAST|nr:hypothetical protein CJD39_08500 [Glaesserella sp. 15-184]RAL18782.1 hypothetical protein C5N92_06525 [Glaesserella australis]